VFLRLLKQYRSEYVKFNRKEICNILLQGAIVLVLISYLFLRSFWGLIFLFPFADIYMATELKKRNLEKRKQITEEFLELLLLLCNNLRAGYSIENSFEQGYKRMVTLYGEESTIAMILRRVIIARKNQASICEVFISAGKSMKLEDICEFGQIYEIAHKRSGNLTNIMDQTAESLLERMNLQKEMYIKLSERTFEMKIMNAMPFVIMSYIEITSPGYFNAMYDSIPGIVGMLCCLVVYMFAYCQSNRLMRFEI